MPISEKINVKNRFYTVYDYIIVQFLFTIKKLSFIKLNET